MAQFDKRNTANAGRHFIEDIDLTTALKNHYNPALVIQKLKEVEIWLGTDEPLSDEELAAKGWKKGYNLTVWTEMPGEIDPTKLLAFVFDLLTGGRLAKPSGPGAAFRKQASQLRNLIF